ncbi:uncharacterized protein LOC129976496 [Argiope bruennichi]|uniref:uncharacterized protein LOC129976496 n=1 Tax=Argiope bruennichi TaxID=94029 RepID=UPI002493FDCA|nr:uncharacterized protein LOC129976496 [Argiope bruennichi]
MQESFEETILGSQFLSLKFIILYCFGLISIFSGMAAIAYGYTIPGSLLILMIPTGCCLYWPLKSLNWSRYCRCLRGICCFAPVDIETPNQPTTPQVLTDSSTPPQSLADSLTLQQPLADSPTPQQPLTDSHVVESASAARQSG